MTPLSDMPEIGKNIAGIRKSKNLSLEELSKRSGVSTGMLSQIETEKVNPTIAVLWKIAYGLNVPFHEILSQEESKRLFNVIHKNEAVILEYDGGMCTFRILTPLSLAEKLEIYTLLMKKDSVRESMAHAPGTEEFVTVINGIVAVEVNGKNAILEEGDTIHFHADVKHVIRNMSEQDGFLYMVVKYLY